MGFLLGRGGHTGVGQFSRGHHEILNLHLFEFNIQNDFWKCCTPMKLSLKKITTKIDMWFHSLHTCLGLGQT